jgi:hypothetical protein
VTLRRAAFWFNVSVNGTLAILEVTLAVVEARAGQPVVLPVLLAVVTGTLTYVAVLVDAYVTAQLATVTAQRRSFDSATAVNEAMAEKIKLATIQFQALEDQREEDRPRRH